VTQALPDVSERRSCRVLQVCRATLHRHPKPSMPSRRLSPTLTARLQELLTQHPTFGYRRLWALLRYREGLVVNRKVVYRILQAQGVARSSTRLHAAAAGARVAEPGQRQQSTLGHGRDPYSVWG
jgi:hypothetical protein